VRLLVRGHVRSRWKRYALVAASLGIGLLGFFAFLMVADGARDAIIRPLGDLITGDVRVTQDHGEIAGGTTWKDYRSVAAEIQQGAGVHASPRLETNYITVRGENFENWSAGLLLGVGWDDAAEQDALRPYLSWGTAVTSLDVVDPRDGHAYTPLVLGTPAVKRLNLTLAPDGKPNFDDVLTLTSGRLVVEGSVPVPITIECVVVGVFSSGLEPLDRFTGFMPLEAARVLAGYHEGDPVANALVIHSAPAGAVRSALPHASGLKSVTDDEFAFDYMGSTLVILYVAGYAGLALFFVALFVWLVHETGVLIRSDQTVLCSLRAIGIPSRKIVWSYVSLTTVSVGVGVVAAWVASLLLGLLAPPLEWHLSGLRASIPWRLEPLAPFLIGLAALLAAMLASWSTARRIQRLNILEGLRSP